jgi:ABC-type lipoprotein export system ATPase subunit
VFSRCERERHVWIIGKTGSGKSTFLFNLALGDIYAKEGVAVIDRTAISPTRGARSSATSSSHPAPPL